MNIIRYISLYLSSTFVKVSDISSSLSSHRPLSLRFPPRHHLPRFLRTTRNQLIRYLNLAQPDSIKKFKVNNSLIIIKHSTYIICNLLKSPRKQRHSSANHAPQIRHLEISQIRNNRLSRVIDSLLPIAIYSPSYWWLGM